MNTGIARNPWNTIWQSATSDGLLIGLLVTVAASLLATLWLPQMPDADPVAYAQWLSNAQATFGGTTDTVQALGLLTITRCFGFRVLLALLAAVLLLRLLEHGDRLLARTEQLRWTLWFPALAQVGALLLLLGQMLAYLWGWQARGLLVQAGERVTLPGTQAWVVVEENPNELAHSRGIVAFTEGCVPGVQVSASDSRGRSLGLQRTPQAEPQQELTLALDEEQFFAVPEAGLVMHLTPHPAESGDTTEALYVRVYRSPPGRLEMEQILHGSGKVSIEGVTLQIASTPFARVAATFNPGLLPTGVGLTLTVVGVVGSVVWHEQTVPTVDEGR